MSKENNKKKKKIKTICDSVNHTVSRKRITYHTEHVGKTKLQRVIVHNNEQRSGCSLVEHITKATAWKDRGKTLEMSVQSSVQLKNEARHLISTVTRAKMLRKIFGKDLVVVL